MHIPNGRFQKLYGKFPEHERNPAHKQCYWKWKNLQHTVVNASGVDKEQQKAIQSEIEKNKAILKRLLDLTLTLSSRNLAFRGKTNTLDNPDNGNFLGFAEFLGRYDDILGDHLDNIRAHREQRMRVQAHYLSTDSQNEFIDLCAQRVLSSILGERQEAAYYSVLCDATPDASHTEQNVIMVRCT